MNEMTESQARDMVLHADHIESGVLFHDEFYMGHITNVHTLQLFNLFETPDCKTAGCALGELHVTFPQSFEMRDNGFVRAIGSEMSMFQAACEFFGITRGECDALFDGDGGSRQDSSERAGMPDHIVSPTDDRASIAASMRRFVSWKGFDIDALRKLLTPRADVVECVKR